MSEASEADGGAAPVPPQDDDGATEVGVAQAGQTEAREPVRAGVWCMGCFYDLRGNTSNRCPECGRWFDPGQPATFSRTPTPERLRKFVKQTALTLSDTLHLLTPPPSADVHKTAIERKVAELWRENATLKLRFELLIDHLVEKGLLQRDEIQAALADVEGAAASAALSIIDDLPEPDDPAPTQDLLDLGRAASPD